MANEKDKHEGTSPNNALWAWSEASGKSSQTKKTSSGKKSKKSTKPEVRRYAFTLIALAILCVICVIGFTPLGEKITQGLDLKGGVSVIMTATRTDGGIPSDEEMDSAVAIVTNRVNSLGASEATVQRQGTNQILVQIPGATDPQQAIDTIGATGVLEFVDLNDISDQDALLKIKNGIENVKLRSGLYEAFMTGDDLRSVSIGMESQGSAYYAVNLRLSDAGTKAFAEVTKRLYPTHSPIAIVLDGVVNSAPHVQAQILNGEVAITGKYTLEDAQSLKTILESGSLPVSLEFSDSSFVGPTLGQDSLRQGLMAVIVGFAIILIYLLFFYQGLGLITAGALTVFGIIYLGVLAMLSSQGLFALSLPGIAGVVLTIGMAADSSILVLERFREELREGRSIRAAAVSGSKHAISTAIDAGIVSLISALGLFFLTTGSVKGFGLTLALGVLCSFFVLLTFTTPLIRLLGRKVIPDNPGFWGVKNDLQEGLEYAASHGSTSAKETLAAQGLSLEGGEA